MNTFYLLRHVSSRLHTCVSRYDADHKKLQSFCEKADCDDFLDEYPELPGKLFEQMDDHFPKIISVNEQIAYGLAEVESTYFIAGPFQMDSMSFTHKIQLERTFPQDRLANVPSCSYHDIMVNMLLIHNLFHNQIIDPDFFSLQNVESQESMHEIQQSLSKSLFLYRENGKGHNSYEQEKREIASIRNGDIEKLKRSWKEDYKGDLGVLAKNTLRNSKNLGIVLVTLASRAAIEGGVIPEEAYTLSDNFIQKIEECQDSDTVLSTARQAEYYYCRMVNKVHEEKTSTPRKKSLNRWVNYCKDYIFSHLHDKITVAEIADEIHINANYLSGIFKEYEGISIREFIIREKVKLAQNMLIYSDYSYIEIAAYLGFSSQSHLGKHFKNITGKTMHQYREEYGVVKEKAYTS